MNDISALGNNGLILSVFTWGDILISVLLFIIIVLLFAVVSNTNAAATNIKSK